jgi:hypothetical protein
MCELLNNLKLIALNELFNAPFFAEKTGKTDFGHEIGKNRFWFTYKLVLAIHSQ